jgi:hypothetical protein
LALKERVDLMKPKKERRFEGDEEENVNASCEGI